MSDNKYKVKVIRLKTIKIPNSNHSYLVRDQEIKPSYLLCDRCGEKIPNNYTTSIAYKRYTDAAGDSDTAYAEGDYCDKCLTKFLSFILSKSDIQDLYRVGRLFKEWINQNDNN